jgi:hypothetical protein
MRILLVLLSLVLNASLYAAVASVRVDAAVTNITSLNANANNRVLTNNLVRAVEGLYVDNRTAAELIVNCPAVAGVPAESSGANFYVAAGKELSLSGLSLGAVRYCYARTVSTTLSTGIFTLLVKGQYIR